MYYKTRTYIAGAWDEDGEAIEQLYKWKNSNYWSLDFVDAHELQQSRDSSNPCSIKASLCMRMEHSKLFVLVVGNKTKNLRSGSCYYCAHHYNGRCYRGHHVSYESFIDYESNKAVRDDMNIIVLYNSTQVNKEWCPLVLRQVGYHVPMKDSFGWNYSKVKGAFDKYL